MKSSIAFVAVLILMMSTTILFAGQITVPGNQLNALRDAIVSAQAGDILLLEAGKVYPNQGKIVLNKALVIKATGNYLTLGKPEIKEVANAAGLYDLLTVEATANITFSNLFFNGAAQGDANPRWAFYHVRSEQPNITVVIDSCIFYKSENGALRFNKATASISITNCLFVNDILTDSQSNGRAIDLREGPHGKVKIQNNTFTNCADRWIRHLWFGHDDCPPIDSLVIDHNTFTQNLGYRPAFQLSSSKYLQITNNIVVNPVMLGTDTMSNRVNEINWMNASYVTRVGPKAITVFNVTQVDSFRTKIVMQNNNVYLEASVGTLYPSSTRVSRAPMFNNEMAALVDTTKATFAEVLTFGKASATNVSSVQAYIQVLDTLTVKGKEILLPNNLSFTLDFSYKDLNLSYSTQSQSYTRASGGFPLGDLNWFPTRKADWVAAGGPTTAVRYNSDLQPSTFSLQQNYPNPFNPTTMIEFGLPERSMVTLKVFNVLGQEIATLVNGFKDAGLYAEEFNAFAMPSGVYFYRLQAGDFVATQRMIILK
jgi:hypothetical protein